LPHFAGAADLSLVVAITRCAVRSVRTGVTNGARAGTFTNAKNALQWHVRVVQAMCGVGASLAHFSVGTALVQTLVFAVFVALTGVPVGACLAGVIVTVARGAVRRFIAGRIVALVCACALAGADLDANVRCTAVVVFVFIVQCGVVLTIVFYLYI